MSWPVPDLGPDPEPLRFYVWSRHANSYAHQQGLCSLYYPEDWNYGSYGGYEDFRVRGVEFRVIRRRCHPGFAQGGRIQQFVYILEEVTTIRLTRHQDRERDEGLSQQQRIVIAQHLSDHEAEATAYRSSYTHWLDERRLRELAQEKAPRCWYCGDAYPLMGWTRYEDRRDTPPPRWRRAWGPDGPAAWCSSVCERRWDAERQRAERAREQERRWLKHGQRRLKAVRQWLKERKKPREA